jgi:hypothetical protein
MFIRSPPQFAFSFFFVVRLAMLRKPRLRPVPVTVGAMEGAIEEYLRQSMPCRDLYELLKDRGKIGSQSDLKFMSSIRIQAHHMS